VVVERLFSPEGSSLVEQAHKNDVVHAFSKVLRGDVVVNVQTYSCSSFLCTILSVSHLRTGTRMVLYL